MFAKVIDIGRMNGRKANESSSPREQASIGPSTAVSASPVEIFNALNEIFSIIDNRIGFFGLEKIKTIGQNYMVKFFNFCNRAKGCWRSSHTH